MTIINIAEFTSYSKETIYEFLIHQAETEFEISLRRISEAVIDPNILVSMDYRNAAYAGQLLCQISESFGYYVPCPQKKTCFQFYISCSNMEKLADILLLIIYGTTRLPRVKVLFWQFQNASAAFMEKIKPGDASCQTEGLLHLARHFYTDED